MSREIEQDGFITREEDLTAVKPEPVEISMVLIKDMEMPKCCPECRLKDSYYQECNAKHKKISTWIKNYNQRPEWCPLVEVVPYGPAGTLYKER